VSIVGRIWQRYIKPLVLSAVYSAAVPTPLRPVLLRVFGATVGDGCHISPGTYLRETNLLLGRDVVLGARQYIDASGKVLIGDRCHVGPGVTIISATHSIQPDVYRRAPSDVQLTEVAIERGCWIGANTTILAGVTIGEGCVIGAGSLVNKSCEANGLYVGSPARRVRDLPTSG